TYCGAFDEFGERNSLLATMEQILDYVKNRSKANKQQGLFESGNIEIPEPPFDLIETEPASKKQTLQWEKQFLGIFLSEHPLKEYENILADFETKIRDINADMVDSEVIIGGILTNCKKILTKNNADMMFCKLEDMTGAVELVVFPKTYESFSGFLQPDNVICAKGRVNLKDGEIKILVNEIDNLDSSKIKDQRAKIKDTDKKSKIYYSMDKKNTNNKFPNSRIPEFSNLIICVPKGSKKTLLENIKNLLEMYPGNSGVTIKIPLNEHFLEKKTNIKVEISQSLLNDLYMLVGKMNIETE
ncbi:MAG: DNA polymerase III subunit alpha, partial [Candidatus Berkelbacteria bacterium Licking1014_85]